MNDMFRFILESSLCLTLFYFLFWAFMKNETHFKLNRIYLLSSIFLSLLIPMFRLPSPFRVTYVREMSVEFSTSALLPASGFGIKEMIAILYFLGAALFFSRFLFHIIHLLLIIRRHGVQHRYGQRIVFIDSDCNPFSFFSYVFVGIESKKKKNLRHIIAHEKAHIRQFHSLDILLIEWITILQWFNPFVWPYKKTLKETHEYLADREVIAQGFNPARYQLLLFEQNIGAKLFEFANNFKQSQIKRRITMMKRIKSGRIGSLKYLLLFPMASLLLLAFSEPRAVIVSESNGNNPDAIVQSSPAVGETGALVQGQTDEEKKGKLKEPPPPPPPPPPTQAELKDEWRKLDEKELILREKMDMASSPEEKSELKKNLVVVLEKKSKIKQMIVSGSNPPPPPEPADLKEEIIKLNELEKKIQYKLESTDDPAMKEDLTKKLQMTKLKREQLKKSYAASGEYIVDRPDPESLKANYKELTEKEKIVKEKLSQTESTEAKQKLEQYLKDIQAKKLQIEKILKDQ